jgi:hypothetical protein
VRLDADQYAGDEFAQSECGDHAENAAVTAPALPSHSPRRRPECVQYGALRQYATLTHDLTRVIDGFSKEQMQWRVRRES